MFVDASAIVAIIAQEPEAADLLACLEGEAAVTSAIAVWESAAALARLSTWTPEEAEQAVRLLLNRIEISVMPIGSTEAILAVQAMARFGKGRHPARLNMGDCFAYACARSRGARLLYKGDDFALTDIASA